MLCDERPIRGDVVVDEQAVGTARRGDAVVEGRMLSGVRLLLDPQERGSLVLREDLRPRIARAVVDEDDLEGVP